MGGRVQVDQTPRTALGGVSATVDIGPVQYTWLVDLLQCW